MKRILLFLMLLPNLHLMAQWTKLNTPSNFFIDDIVVLKDSTIIAISNNILTFEHNIYRSVDHGSTWTIQKSFPQYNFGRALEIDKKGNLFAGVRDAVSHISYIYKSTDNGLNWIEVLNDPTTDGIFAFSFIDNLGYASGFNGAIYKTSDYGVNWQKMNTPDSNADLTTLQFIDSLKGFTGSSSNGYIYTTTDGGLTWNTIPIDTSDYVTGISMFNSQSGIVCTYFGGDVYRTDDGGLTWSVVKSYPNVYMFSAAVIGKYGFIGGWDGYTMSSDTGKTWTAQSLGNGDINDFYFTSHGVYAAGTEIHFLNMDLSEHFEQFTGLNEIYSLNSSLINLFPNPAKDVLTIELADIQNINSYLIMDIQGKVFINESPSIQQSKISIDVVNIPPGIYAIKLFTDRGIIVKKWIKH